MCHEHVWKLHILKKVLPGPQVTKTSPVVPKVSLYYCSSIRQFNIYEKIVELARWYRWGKILWFELMRGIQLSHVLGCRLMLRTILKVPSGSKRAGHGRPVEHGLWGKQTWDGYLVPWLLWDLELETSPPCISFLLLHNQLPHTWCLIITHIYYLVASTVRISLAWSSIQGLTSLQSKCQPGLCLSESLTGQESASRLLWIVGGLHFLEVMWLNVCLKPVPCCQL